MATDKKKRDVVALASVALALALLIVANLVADRVFKRWDLTQEKRYSLSDPFYNIIRGLEDPLKITYYVSENVPAEFEVYKRDLLDKLNEIQTGSEGRIQVEIVDPNKDPKLMQALVKENPQIKVTLPSIQKDRKVLTNFVTAIRLTYQAKPTVLLARVGTADGLEYLLGSQITTLTLKEKPVIAIHFPPSRRPGPAAQQQPGTFEWIAETPATLDDKYDKRVVHLVEGSSIPPSTRLLILIRPKNLSDRARYEIGKYLAEGGRVLLVSSPWEINVQTGIVEKVQSRLEDDLREWGVGFVPALVCDESNVALLPRVIQKDGIQLYQMQPHPFFVKIQPQNVDQGSDNPITRFLPGLVMPYTSAVMLDEEKARAAGFTAEVLAKTSPRTWTEPLPQFVDLNVGSKPPAKFDAQRAMFARLTGQFPFAWEGMSPPAWPVGEEGPKKKEPAAELKKAEGMLFVLPCPEAFSFFFLNQGMEDPQLRDDFAGNFALLLNVAENCALGDELVKMRIKRYETRAIKKFEEEGGETRRNLLKAIAILGVPAVVIAFAVAYWLMRREAQLSYERTFAKTTGPSSFGA